MWWDRFVPNTRAFDPVLTGTAAALLLLWLWTLVLSFRFRSLGKRYRTLFGAMSGGAGADLEILLHDYLETAREAHGQSQRAVNLLETVEEVQRGCYQRSGVVRYDAFNDTSGYLSFSLALMDDRQNGFILTGMQGRGGTSIYAKSLREGRSEIPLTDEEREAIRLALSPDAPFAVTKGKR